MGGQQRFLLQDHPGYSEVQVLGKGAFGQVILAVARDTGQHVALKFIPRGSQINKYVEREISNQLRLRHPHIIELKEVFLTGEHLVVAMEYAAGGNLQRRVVSSGKLSEEDARWYFQQIMFALDYCHRMGVANRDLKLENTLLSDNSRRPLVKLADFGFSKDENIHSAPGSRVGTPAYLAPEIITNVEGRTYDGRKADVWSCGVLLFIMLTGRYPFLWEQDKARAAGHQLHYMLQRIIRVDYRFPEGTGLSSECRDLITNMLLADPDQRLSVQQVLRHPWTASGLNFDVLCFNDPLVAKTLASPPAPEMLRDIAGIVAEAQSLPGNQRRQEQQQQQQGDLPQLRGLQPQRQRQRSGGSGPSSFHDPDALDLELDDSEFRPV